MNTKIRHFINEYVKLWYAIPLILAFIALAAIGVDRGAKYPEAAVDGAKWQKEWTLLGRVMGVEAPEGLTLLNNDTVLAGDDTYYASWVRGEATDFINAAGEDVKLYPMQIYLLVYGCEDDVAARAARDDWTEREAGNYSEAVRSGSTHNSQVYEIYDYSGSASDNPYDRMASAFGLFGNYVVIAECAATTDFDGDVHDALTRFLDSCHYSASAIK